MPYIRIVLRLTVLILWSLCLIPIQCIVLFFTQRNGAFIIPCLWQRGVCRISGLRYRIIGIPVTHQVIYVANHLSYLDIPVIGSILKASFVAKSDVESWPVFGFLGKIQQAVFISRKTSDAAKVSQSLGRVVSSGKSLILFPEGTSTTGETVLPFKSSLFNLPDGDDGKKYSLPIQPITVRLISVHGEDVANNPSLRLLYAWVGDMTLVPHLLAFWGGSGAEIELVFHPVIDNHADSDRKMLAQLAWQAVSSGLDPVK